MVCSGQFLLCPHLTLTPPTAIDAFSTALVMENAEVVNTLLNYIPTINFDQTAAETPEISLFETTIRYIGGLLAGMSW